MAMRNATKSADEPKLDIWAYVEIMGHNQIAGHLTEQTIAGQGFLRIDVPAVDEVPGYTKLISPSSVYAINPIGEVEAVAIARKLRKRPIEPYMMAPAQRPAESFGLPAPESCEVDDDEMIESTEY